MEKVDLNFEIYEDYGSDADAVGRAPALDVVPTIPPERERPAFYPSIPLQQVGRVCVAFCDLHSRHRVASCDVTLRVITALVST